MITPGSLIVAEGRDLDRIVAGTLGDEPLSSVTVVNDTLITATTPQSLTDGIHTLVLRRVDGGTVKLSVTVRAAAVDPLRAAAPAEAAAATGTPTTVNASADPTPVSASPSSGVAPAPIGGAPTLAVQSGSARAGEDDHDDTEKNKAKDNERPKPVAPSGGNGRGAKRGR